MSTRPILRSDEIRYDSLSGSPELVLDVEAAAEATRYHVIVVPTRGRWLVTVENLTTPVCVVLPQLFGWHWTYLRQHCDNDRTAMALGHILDRAHVWLNARDTGEW